MAGDFAGYHIPQVVMPGHYASKRAWRDLHKKMKGLGGYTKAKFTNEVLGEESEESMCLVSQIDLEKAATLHPNTEEEALAAAKQYIYRVLSIDWGGGGKDEISLTCPVVLGMKPDGRVDVLYARKLPNPEDHLGEARECLRLFRVFNCHRCVHDFGGGGSLRETMMLQAGMPYESLIPVSYVGGPGKRQLVTYHPDDQNHPRRFWSMDKARSLQITAYAIKYGQLKFYRYDHISPEEPGYIHDFLALLENKIPTAAGSDIYSIIRHPIWPDDFAQAVNIGAIILWHINDSWPDWATHLLGK
jgi:hypothetical protein